VVLDQPVQDLYGSHWSVTGRGTPDETTPDEAVFLPGRNPLLLMKAGLWCQLHGVQRLALAPLHSNPFPDASPEFFDGFAALLTRALGEPLSIVRPFATLEKRQVMELGRGVPWQYSFSCIAPVQGEHCGACNKCAERQAAFAAIGTPDPTCYARAPLA
jgi:7-cyano-7-deazaguanine synthase